LAGRVVVTVDVPPDARTPEQLDIVAAREQADVVDLRDSRHKTLDGACDQILVVATAERVVERAVDLRRVHVARHAAAGQTTLAVAPLVDTVAGRGRCVA